MTDTEQKNRSFRKLRLAAGYGMSALEAKAQIPKKTLFSWERGHRPPWMYMPALANAFGLELAELIKILWNESPGDLCQCGCGAKKVYPEEFPRLRRLALAHTCSCGRTRLHTDQPSHHLPLCLRCAARLRIRERVVLTCVGFRDPLWKKDGRTRRGPKCPGTIALTPSALQSYKKLAKHAQENPSHWGSKRDWSAPGKYGKLKWAPAFRDKATATFRCTSCARSSFSTAVNEQKLKAFLRSRKIKHGRIESRDERRELISTFFEELSPSLARVIKKRKERRKFQLASPHIKPWSNGVPRSIRLGRCVVCRKITITRGKKPNKFHNSCFRRWSRTPAGKHYYACILRGREASLPSIGAGQPVTEENLRNYFAWAGQKYLSGISYREIGQEAGVHHSLVQRQVEFLLANVPDPGVLERRFQPRIFALLRSAEKSVKS